MRLTKRRLKKIKLQNFKFGRWCVIYIKCSCKSSKNGLKSLKIWIPFLKKIGRFICAHCIMPKKIEDFKSNWSEEQIRIIKN